MKKTALVLGGGGFIGGHLAKRLKEEGYYVRVVDIKQHEHFTSEEICNEFLVYDLRDPKNVEAIFRLESTRGSILPFSYYKQPFTDIESFDEVYQLAADMGGAGYIFTGRSEEHV
jgi:nucleoside-diphosphate-sugar epimerase